MSIPNEPDVPKKTIPDFSKDLVNPKKPFHYLGNRRLKGSGIVIPFTGEHINELQQCEEDVFYFAENYYMIVHVDRGKEIIKLRPYQKRMINSFQNNRFNIALASRQTGKCVFSNNIIHLRNKKTGEIKKVEIGEHYSQSDELKNHNKISL